MIRICTLADTVALAGDPLLRREVYSYLSYCMSEYEEEDDMEFEFAVLSEEDLPMLADLGQPEETVKITVDDGAAVRTITRLVYAAEVFFVLGEDTWTDAGASGPPRNGQANSPDGRCHA